jgi:hypothetical protein
MCLGTPILNSGGAVFDVGVGMGITSLVIILLRLYSRIAIANKIGIDDWFILIAGVCISLLKFHVQPELTFL